MIFPTQRSGSGRALARIASIVVFGTLAVGGCREREVSDAPDPHVAHGSHPASAAPAPTAPTRVLYPSTPGSFVELVDKARHGVVAIRAASPVKSGPAAIFPGSPETTADVALGTGFLIESHGVYVLTTDHIAAASPELRVVLPDHRELAAKLVGRDPRLDLALLSIDGRGMPPAGSAPEGGRGSIDGRGMLPAGSAPEGGRGSIDAPKLTPLPLGSSDDLQVGEWLVVLGNAFGDEVSASAGIVSATGRDVAGSIIPEHGRAMSFRTFLQTDARIHRGNSGGPVIDTAGQVVGVAVATGDRPGEVSFAIPINRVKEVVDALREFGQVSRSWLGVLVQPVDADRAAAAGLDKPTGGLVTEVKAGSPAARAGLRTGDIIVAWGDRAVDHQSLPSLVAQTPAGKATTVTVWRNKAQTQLAVMTEKMPE